MSVNLKLTDEQAKSLVAIMHSGMASYTVNELGLNEVVSKLAGAIGFYSLTNIQSILKSPPRGTITVKRVDDDRDRILNIDCT